METTIKIHLKYIEAVSDIEISALPYTLLLIDSELDFSIIMINQGSI